LQDGDFIIFQKKLRPASLLLVDSVDRYDKLTVDLIYGLSPSLALILAKVCPDSLLAGGMACREIV
jgi:hypothetical protein